jgi:FdhD protein
VGPEAGDVQTESRRVSRWREGRLEPDQPDPIVREQPLEIRVEERSLAVTMRTPGDDLDLAAGFLFTEGVIDGPDDLVGLGHLPGDGYGNTVIARVAGGVEAHLQAIERASRELYATSACGMCGKVSLDRIRMLAPPVQPLEPEPSVLLALPDRLRATQPAFSLTGGIHGAGLFLPDGQLVLAREDVGRHNAVDKVLGACLRAGQVPVRDRILLVTGRAGFEIVQKARVAGVPVVAAMGAASDLAIDLALDGGMALFGFLRADRFTRYA